MPSRTIRIADGVEVGGDRPLVLIAGPDVVENADHALKLARALRDVCSRRGVPLVFKASFDKANRTSVDSFRGPGLDAGLRALERVRRETGLPITTDFHTPDQARTVAEVADLLQVPAFLCRQTDMLVAAGRTGRAVNVKRGQFVAPHDARAIVDKVLSTGNDRVMLTERGASFGYNNLVVDFRGLPRMRDLGVPVCFDATHSVQLPGGQGTSSGGQREFVPVLARAAVASGISGLFMETHPQPEKALSDGPNAWPLKHMKALLQTLTAIDALVKREGFAENNL